MYFFVFFFLLLAFYFLSLLFFGYISIFNCYSVNPNVNEITFLPTPALFYMQKHRLTFKKLRLKVDPFSVA